MADTKGTLAWYSRGLTRFQARMRGEALRLDTRGVGEPQIDAKENVGLAERKFRGKSPSLEIQRRLDVHSPAEEHLARY